MLDLGSGDGRLLGGLFFLGFFGLRFLSLRFFGLRLGLGFFFLLGFVGLDVFGLLLGRFLDLLFGLFVVLGFFFLLRLLGLRFFSLRRFRRGLGLRLFLRRGRRLGFRFFLRRGLRLLHGFRRFLLRRFFLILLLDHLDDFGVLVRLRVLGKAGHAARDAQRRREHQRHNLVPTVFHLEKPPSDWFRSIFERPARPFRAALYRHGETKLFRARHICVIRRRGLRPSLFCV